MSKYTAHKDTFSRDNLPPKAQWPDFISLDNYHYSEKMNCVTRLLDDAIDEGFTDKTFFYSSDKNWSYGDLQQTANQIAQVLVEDLNMLPGERVILSSPNNPWMAACWLGIIKAGGVAVSTMAMLKGPELAVIANKSEVRWALADERLRSELDKCMTESPTIEKLYCFGGGELEELAANKSGLFTNVETAADDVCLIAFTSGTTGKPKGTMHFHRDLLSVCHSFCDKTLKPKQTDIFTGSPPLAFTFGLGGLLLFPLWARASVVLVEMPTPENLENVIKKHQVSTLVTSPTAYRGILGQIDSFNLDSLTTCISAGEHLPLATYEAWLKATGIKMIDGIGSTELFHIFISASGDDIRPGATGKAVPGYEAKIINELGATLAAGEMGLLAVRGPTGCRYLNDSRQADYIKNGWNITGDTYTMDEDGYFWFHSRSDDMIVSSGYNIAGPEVENALLGHPAVTEVAVIASPDEHRGSIVKAFIVLAESYKKSDPELLQKKQLINELQDFVKQSIAPYKYPRSIAFLEQLPKTGTGKTQHVVLRNKELEEANLKTLSK